MSQQLLKHFSIEVQQKFYEKETPSGHLAIYQTTPFGMTLLLNGQVLLCEYDSFFYHEMMSHPALFSHAHPEKIAIVGNRIGILQEVLKHPQVKEIVCVNDDLTLEKTITEYFGDSYPVNDQRVKQIIASPLDWMMTQSNYFDVIILTEHSENFLIEHYQHYHHALQADGILVQVCQSSWLNAKILKPIYQNIQHAGFPDWQLLHFPQPSYPQGLRTIMMATKRTTFKRLREVDIYNRPFVTRYYNFDVHKAALVLPEFMRIELENMN